MTTTDLPRESARALMGRLEPPARMRRRAPGLCVLWCLLVLIAPAVASASPAGTISTVAGTGVVGGSGDLGPATSATLNTPLDAAVDAFGNLLIDDVYNSKVRMVAGASCAVSCPFGLVATRGNMYTVAGNGIAGFLGDGALASLAEMNYPSGVAVDKSGNLFIVDQRNSRVRMVAGAVCAYACAFGLPVTFKGAIYTVAGNGGIGYWGDGGPATSAGLRYPSRVAVDALGDLLIADPYNQRVRLVAATSCTTGCPFGLAAMTKGNIYTIAGNGTVGNGGDSGPATSAQMRSPNGLALDNSGDLLIADTQNQEIRMVAGKSCTSACPFGLVGLVKGNMYRPVGVGAKGYGGEGVSAYSAAMNNPMDVALTPAGDLLIADQLNNRVRMVPAASCTSPCPFGLTSIYANAIYTIAGNGARGSAGDGGPARSAQVYQPQGLAVDRSGNVLIADTYNNKVRMVIHGTPPAITSAAATAFTIGHAGSFTVTATGQPIPALSASGALPAGVTFRDNHNGTATLSGTPAAGTAGTYKLTITAGNGLAPNANQAFTLTVS
jgi:sugar lactone lactonase YvrE